MIYSYTSSEHAKDHSQYLDGFLHVHFRGAHGSGVVGLTPAGFCIFWTQRWSKKILEKLDWDPVTCYFWQWQQYAWFLCHCL